MASESTPNHPSSRDTPNSDSGNVLPSHENDELDFIRDEDFYFNSIIFRAGKTHFKVPVYALPLEEGVFSAMLEFPNENGEGLSDQNPIVLPAEVTPMDFRSFLKACIPMPDNVSTPTLTVHEWMSVLKLSTMWCLGDLRTKAIESADKEVSSLGTAGEDSAIQKILLGKRYCVSRWLLEGYESIGKRVAYLTASERVQLGVETSFRISELREKSWAWAHTRLPPAAPAPFGAPYPAALFGTEYTHQHSIFRDRNKFDYSSAVRTIFEDELRLDPHYNPSNQFPLASQSAKKRKKGRA
ncbi:unnamed protein product [Peniophora sp. CBMAI 1063]|nr:unnamed protein product [Peniophora sp. CBMAI 1063]